VHFGRTSEAGFNLVVWTLPPFAVLLAGCVVVKFFHRQRAIIEKETDKSSKPLPPDQQRLADRVEDEPQEWDG